MSLTKIGSIGINTGIAFAGVTTITTLNGSDAILSVGGTVNFVSDVSIGGTVSIAGTLTYEDVTNVDAVGLITAQNGIVVGSGITLSKDGDIFATGVVTATSYAGDGSGLTGIAATDNVRTGILDVAGIATFRADAIFNADARITDSIIHEGDTNTKIRFPAADTITAETGGSERVRINSDGDLLVGRTSTIDASEVLGIKGPDSEHCTFGVTSDGTTQAGIIAFNDDDATFRGRVQYNHTDDSMVFHTAGSERLSINSSGRITTPLGTSTKIGVADRTSGTGAGGSLLVTAGAARGSSQTTGNLLLAAGRGNNSANNGEIRFGYNDGSEGTGLDGEHARIDSNGKLLGGNYFTSKQIGSVTAPVQIQGTSADTSALSLFRYSNDTGGSTITLGKGRGTSGGATDKPQENDTVGTIHFHVANNNDLVNGNVAAIDAQVDDAPGGGDTPGRIRFLTSPDGSSTLTERLRITKDGTVTNSQSGNAPTSGSAFGFTQDQLYLSTAGTSANYALRFYNDNGLVGSVLVNGSSSTYNTSSDYRLKENQVSISDAISKVKRLKPYTFNFKADSSTKIDGFFAHEAQEVVPHAVSGEKDDEQMQSMDYGKLTPLLTAALQEAITEIEVLKSEVADLKSQLNN